MTGDGSGGNSYKVAGVADWLELEGKSGHVDIIADIDFNSAGSRTTVPSITPAGELYIFGNGHTLSNFYQELTDVKADGGLFSEFSGVIFDLNIDNAYILGTAVRASVSGNAGIIAAVCGKCEITNVMVRGAINTVARSGNTSAGGYFGSTIALDGAGYESEVVSNPYDITIMNCISNVNIHNHYRTGGFIGDAHRDGSIQFQNDISACKFFENNERVAGYIGSGHGTNHASYYLNCISQCDFTSSVSYEAAGFEVITTTKSQLTNCASICNMKCTASTPSGHASGIGGSNLVQCYSKCTFDGFSTTGGITRYSSSNYTIVHCYAACIHTNLGTGSHYGLGSDNCSFTMSFYDAELFPDASTTTGAATTEQLKSAEWLREQGWAI